MKPIWRLRMAYWRERVNHLRLRYEVCESATSMIEYKKAYEIWLKVVGHAVHLDVRDNITTEED